MYLVHTRVCFQCTFVNTSWKCASHRLWDPYAPPFCPLNTKVMKSSGTELTTVSEQFEQNLNRKADTKSEFRLN